MTEIPKTYEPAAIETKWYAFWEQTGCFTADPKSPKPAYSIVIPPPNVTGHLTLGHVLNNTIQDILARRARMLGKEVLWLPGTDHAGIATQNVVEKTLRKEGSMKHRDDLGREALVGKIWEWKEKYGGIILKQLRALGASCDWSRTRFTMDPEYSACVQRVFVDLYKKGLIYRGKRMVNWCPASLTALSDEEVVMKEQNGLMYHFKVEVVEQPGTFLTIATTRPETIPADTAVAVNPNDPRYTHLIGKHVWRALGERVQIPIIADEHVTFDFGTGVLKVTPAHDKADYEIGLRHKLPVIDVLTPDGKMTDLAGPELAGMERFAARKKSAELLEAAGALEKTEPYKNNVGFSERADVPIEPRLSEQWFLKYPSVEASKACVEQGEKNTASDGKSLEAHPANGKLAAQPASDAVESDNASARVAHRHVSADMLVPTASSLGGGVTAQESESNSADGKMRFYPPRWAKVYDHWMTGIQDWCISRQLWWGHRVPVWVHRPKSKVRPEFLPAIFLPEFDSIGKEGGKTISLSGVAGTATFLRHEELFFDKEPGGLVTYAATLDEVERRLLEQHGFTQDPDVLDTWFSSWLWPFATMGWPEKTDTLSRFYPTTDLVTGPDIIFFWVARMIMAGYEWMGDLPFRNVYFTGIIRDKQGRKLSKSLGNSPDPLDLIAKYGADALRFGTMRSAPLGTDVVYDEKNVELGRNFCTKLWNAARFRQMQGGETEAEIRTELLSSDDKWILARLDDAVREVSAALDEYRFSDASAVLYRFFWSEYCDWYVEASKATLPSFAVLESLQKGEPDPRDKEEIARSANTLAVMDFVFSHTLRLFHPYLPFITEELWTGMGFASDLPPKQGGETIMFAVWPKPFTEDERAYFGLDETSDALAKAKYATVEAGRGLRRDFNLPGNKKNRFVLKPSGALEPHEANVVRLLLNADPLEIAAADWQPTKGTPVALTPLGELFLPLDGLIDVAAERERIGKELAKVESELEKVRAKLADPNFAGKVPAKVLEEHQQRERDWAEKHTQLAKMRDALG